MTEWYVNSQFYVLYIFCPRNKKCTTQTINKCKQKQLQRDAHNTEGIGLTSLIRMTKYYVRNMFALIFHVEANTSPTRRFFSVFS